ncbi:hypothetical protein [Curtobacterium sp. 24E2]|nr:hypothetical protein JN350_05185 [Curtobacterium sp. 24E2]
MDRVELARPVWRVLGVFTAVALLGLTMNWISATLVAPLFAYLGYTYVPASWQVLLVVLLMTTGVALALPGYWPGRRTSCSGPSSSCA